MFKIYSVLLVLVVSGICSAISVPHLIATSSDANKWTLEKQQLEGGYFNPAPRQSIRGDSQQKFNVETQSGYVMSLLYRIQLNTTPKEATAQIISQVFQNSTWECTMIMKGTKFSDVGVGLKQPRCFFISAEDPYLPFSVVGSSNTKIAEVEIIINNEFEDGAMNLYSADVQDMDASVLPEVIHAGSVERVKFSPETDNYSFTVSYERDGHFYSLGSFIENDTIIIGGVDDILKAPGDGTGKYRTRVTNTPAGVVVQMEFSTPHLKN
ncbi:hypothetical protein RCL1_006529 [Eukaryota sp. TZLM3-RCL]